MLKKKFKLVLNILTISILTILFNGGLFSYLRIDAMESGDGYIILNEVVALNNNQNITNFKQYRVILEDGSILKKPGLKKPEASKTPQPTKIIQKPDQSNQTTQNKKPIIENTSAKNDTKSDPKLNPVTSSVVSAENKSTQAIVLKTDEAASVNSSTDKKPETVTQVTYPDLSTMQVKDLINKYSQKYEIDSGIPLQIADCESEFKTNLIGSGKYYGVFQLSKPTFDEFSKNLDFQNPDINNPEQNIEIGVYIISQGQAWRWGCK